MIYYFKTLTKQTSMKESGVSAVFKNPSSVIFGSSTCPWE